MSFFDSFLGGAAESGAGIIGNQIKSDQDMARQTGLAKLQSELLLDRETAVANLQNQLKNQPMNDFAQYAANHSDDTMPAPAPTALTGTQNPGGSVDNNGNPIQSNGLTGNINKLKAIANGMDDSNPDKAGLLDQINAQSKQQQDSAPPIPIDRSGMINAGLKDALADGNGAAFAAGNSIYHGDQMIAAQQDKISMLTDRYNDQRTSAMERNQVAGQIADATVKLKEAQAHLDDAKSKGQVGGDPATTVQRTIQQADGSYVAVMKDGSTKDLNMKSGALEKQAVAYATKVAETDRDFAKLPKDQQLSQAKNALLTLALSKPQDASPTPAQSTPQGMNFVGMSPNGKPVYEDANGKRFTN